MTRTFRVTGLIVVAGIGCLVLGSAGVVPSLAQPLGVLALVFICPVFLVSATRHLLRGLLWRVGSRLFVSYVLIGFLPIVLIATLAFLAAIILAGQLAANRAERAVNRRLETLEVLAARLVGEKTPESAFEPVRTAHTKELPGLTLVSSAGGPFSPPEESLPPRFLVRTEAALWLGASAEGGGRHVVLAAPFDRALESSLEEETDVTIRVEDLKRRTRQSNDDANRGVTIQVGKEKSHFSVVAGASDMSQDVEARSGPARWVGWVVLLEEPVRSQGTLKPIADEHGILWVKTTIRREFTGLFPRAHLGSTSFDTGHVIQRVMVVVGAMTLGLYALALVVAAILVSRIARATKRLSLAFGEVGKGNLSYRALLTGQDQLAGLIAGFNVMSASLETNVAARAQQEALEHELAVARDLQRRLLPSADFRFPGVSIAADFKPAAAIGGDFYHLVAEGDARLTVVVGDVSGHGLPTGIVMASAKASLSALAATGAPTRQIFETLDREIRETTQRRTFVTLAHATFRLKERRLDFTNAGHPYPYRVTSAGVTTVENASRPLGTRLPSGFPTVSAPIASSDLWVFYSDGIIEARNAQGDVWGFSGFEACLASGAGGTAEALRDSVLEAWRAFTGRDEPEDDRTLVVVKVE